MVVKIVINNDKLLFSLLSVPIGSPTTNHLMKGFFFPLNFFVICISYYYFLCKPWPWLQNHCICLTHKALERIAQLQAVTNDHMAHDNSFIPTLFISDSDTQSRCWTHRHKYMLYAAHDAHKCTRLNYSCRGARPARAQPHIHHYKSHGLRNINTI